MSDEDSKATVTDIMYRRGYRDGLAGLSPSSTPASYFQGYIAGQSERID